MRAIPFAALLLPALALAAAAQSAALQIEGWQSYANALFGVRADDPAVFAVKDPPPDNGESQTFRTRRGDMELRVFAHYNAAEQTPWQMMEAQREPGDDHSPARATAKWFVLSERHDGMISYLRCTLDADAGDIVGGVALRYSAEEAKRWKPRV